MDGDGLPDLVLRHADGGWDGFQVLRNLGKGKFAPPIAPLGPVAEVEPVRQWEVVHFGDLDGDGRAEYVTQEEIEEEDGGLRKEMRQVKRPQLHLRVQRATGALAMEEQPIQEIEIEGYAFDFADERGG